MAPVGNNPPLQARAGRNIGIEAPLGQAYLQSAGAPQVNASDNGDTVILECPEHTARALYYSDAATQLGGNLGQGLIVNTSNADVDYEVFFRDVEGNEISLGFGAVVAGDVGPFSYFVSGYLFESVNLVLCEGEKIVLRVKPSGQ